MKNFTYLLTVLSAFVAFAFVSCEKDTTDNDKPDPIESFLSVEADTVFFTGDAAENRIVAVKAIDNSWVAACQDDASWCKVNTSKNSLGEKEIKISVDKNEDTLARECTVEVTLDALSEKFVVKQLGTQSDEATKIVIEKTEYETDFQAGELSVTVVANGTFTASTDTDWVKYKGANRLRGRNRQGHIRDCRQRKLRTALRRTDDFQPLDFGSGCPHPKRLQTASRIGDRNKSRIQQRHCQRRNIGRNGLHHLNRGRQIMDYPRG
ncbi:MAG: hypothetical protein L6V35_05190 [Alistipes putredinis]|nr:MAG: hypothetical protein L6V35_05190 [Alistipes putredinis]